MTRIVINDCIGGFDLSVEALKRFNALSNHQEDAAYYITRDNPYLVQVVEEMGDSANADHAALKIVEIPDDIMWYVQDGYDGRETIHERHRMWE